MAGGWAVVAVDHRDLGLFGGSFGASGGEVDVTPPSVFLTLNDIPDDMNDLLVVPPEGFQIPKESAAESRVLVIASPQFLANPFARAGNPPPMPPQMQMMGANFGGDRTLQAIAGPYGCA